MVYQFVRRATSVTVLLILSACGPAKTAHDEGAAPAALKQELAAKPDTRLESIEPSPVRVRTTAAPAAVKPAPISAGPADPQPTGYYNKAVDCVARLNVVILLVQSDVIVEPEIVRFAGRAQGIWQDRATARGRVQGLSARQVQTDIDRRQLSLINPIITGRRSDVAPLINSLVRQASTCEF